MWLEGQDVDSENKASHGEISYFLEFTLNPQTLKGVTNEKD